AARGCIRGSRPAAVLEVGAGIRPTATVEARVADGDWQTCDYDRLPGEYRCADLVTVFDAMTNTVNDMYPSWAFTTPATGASPDRDDVEARIPINPRLAGVYWPAVSDGRAELDIEGERTWTIDRKTEVFVADDRVRRVVIQARLPTTWSFTFVN